MNDTRETLALKNLAIGYRPTRKEIKIIADNLNVNLNSGELVCLLGPNGAGKSTLLRTIAGMQPPISGEVWLDGLNIHQIRSPELAKKLSVVLTEKITIGTLSAYSLVALGRYPHTNWAGTLSEKDHEIIRKSIEMVGAAELANRNVSELSDGERQKIMVARALAQEPQVLILDEITAFLDLPRRVEIMRMLREMSRKTGKAILLSSHDLDLALRTADKLWLLGKGGKFQKGSPEDLVLSGEFEEVFQGEGIEFDRTAGYFKLHTNPIGKVKIIGRSDVAIWTERALKRQGFEIAGKNEISDFSVEVKTNNGDSIWFLTALNGSQSFNSIYELNSVLEKNFRTEL